MCKKIVAANWKMYGTKQSVATLTNVLAHFQADCEIIIFPPCVFIPMVSDILCDTYVHLGAQNAAAEPSGAFTGEVSANMLHEFGCRYVLLGHSERRQLFHETNDIVAKKFAAAQQANLIPLLCVGETWEERQADNTLMVILRQIDDVLEITGIASLQRDIIAYEPILAIGTGLTAKPEQVQSVHAKICEHIAQIDGKIANSIKIIYGGSVNANNAASLFVMPDIDGGLVGGASLDSAAFCKICKVA
jgi:triosephosphate isomerase